MIKHKPNNIPGNFAVAGVVLFLVFIVAFIVSIRGSLKSVLGFIIGGVYWFLKSVSPMAIEKQVMIFAIIGLLICYIGYKVFKKYPRVPPAMKNQRRF